MTDLRFQTFASEYLPDLVPVRFRVTLPTAFGDLSQERVIYVTDQWGASARDVVSQIVRPKLLSDPYSVEFENKILTRSAGYGSVAVDWEQDKIYLPDTAYSALESRIREQIVNSLDL